jgi:hypothetical protein
MLSRYRLRASGRLWAAAVALAALLLQAGPGCGGGPVTVRGTVKFEGQPVTEGTVQFNDEKTGSGAEAELQPDGTYTATLPTGSYKVIILPPLVVESAGGMPDPRYKKVRNIPEKYRSTATSGLTATVAPDKAVHDFDLKP